MQFKKYDLDLIAKHVMEERGLIPEFSNEIFEELKFLENSETTSNLKDLRHLLWCSIDNDNSLDLDQLTYAERNPDDSVTIWVAIADVSSLVKRESAIDNHAQINTTSVYTPSIIFPMLPQLLSNDLTSLNENEDRSAMVVEINLDNHGEIQDSKIFKALVYNYAKLTYSAVGAWLEETRPLPEKINKNPDLEKSLKCQHVTAQLLKKNRLILGALTFETLEPQVKLKENSEVVLQLSGHNLAHELIENLMILANTVTAQKLKSLKIPSLRRVVKEPKKWDRIVELAQILRYTLPDEPDPKALEAFLEERKKVDPESFPDLSLAIIKLLGRGEYIVETAESESFGHFGLALKNYTHSTAPNRRFPDLITQRQYKAFLDNKNSPYSLEELFMLAEHCTNQEDAAMKVERHMLKSAAALALSSSIGKTFKGIITGASEKGTWVRIFTPPVEGKILRGNKNLDVGDRVSVNLVSVDVLKGHINFIIS